MPRRPGVLVIVLVLTGCGGSRAAERSAREGEPSAEDDMIAHAGSASADRESVFGPLSVGAEYRGYRRVTTEPFLSVVHGNRWVDVYVSEGGADAYVKGREIPVGTIIVKDSWLDDQGKASAVPGPIYVMEKRAAGYAPDHRDWFFAIHWAKPTGRLAAGGPMYWRGSSPRVDFCRDCHDSYDRGLGGLLPSSMLLR